MGASEYLSNKTEGSESPIKAAYSTAGACIFAVILLILPYFILGNPLFSIIFTLSISIVIIFVFTYYISVVKDYNFRKRFFEMAAISLGIAALSFVIGFFIKWFLGVDI